MKVQISLFFILVTLFVIGFLWWNMTKGTTTTTASVTVTPKTVMGITIPPQLDVPKAAKSVSQQTIRNLNRLYGNGILPPKSDYGKLQASGKVYWNPNVGSWQATSGSARGYTGVGNPTAMDIQNLNRMYGKGKVPGGSRLAALADSNKVSFIGGKWVSNVSSGAPSASNVVTDQTIRNLNRMYGNGKLPVKSDYAGLVSSGKVYWNPNIGSWQGTSGSAKGYTGVGNPELTDINSLNRLYPDGKVPDGSRFKPMVDAQKAVYIGGKWV